MAKGEEKADLREGVEDSGRIDECVVSSVAQILRLPALLSAHALPDSGRRRGRGCGSARQAHVLASNHLDAREAPRMIQFGRWPEYRRA